MSVHSITLEGTSSVRLPVGGKYCDRDIVISTVGGPVLPALTTPGAAEDLLEGKQLIDGDGNVVEGAMPIQDTDAVSLTPTNYSYTIPAGYHPGGKKVTARRGGKTVTPTKTQQTVSSTSMFLNTVTVDPIPDQYQDVTAVTATAEDVAEGKVFVDSTGAVVTGTAEMGGGVKIASGTYTATSNFNYSALSNEVIAHNLGYVPTNMILLGKTNTSTGFTYAFHHIHFSPTGTYMVYSQSSSNIKVLSSTSTYQDVASATTKTSKLFPSFTSIPSNLRVPVNGTVEWFVW